MIILLIVCKIKKRVKKLRLKIYEDEVFSGLILGWSSKAIESRFGRWHWFHL